MSNNLRKLKRAFETQRQQRDAVEFQRMIARAEAEQLERAKRERFAKSHPVTSGLVPLVEYREPQWGYKR